MRTPFPYFGSKRRVAHEIWDRFGDPSYYFEPFGGTLGTLLERPEPTSTTRYEYVGDTDCLLTNFYRAAKFANPEELARLTDWPASQIDLDARTKWLPLQRRRLERQLISDPNWYDLQCAAWFAWVQSVKIGRFTRSLVLARSSGVCRKKQDLTTYFTALADRLKGVMIHFGDWTKLTNEAESVSTRGATAILLDPPYRYATGRQKDLYLTDSGDVAEYVHRWALARAQTHPKLKIALCGFAGEHKMPPTWEEVAWSSKLGKGRERIWFSPSCQPPAEAKTEAIQSRDTVPQEKMVIRSGDDCLPLGCRPVSVLSRF